MKMKFQCLAETHINKQLTMRLKTNITISCKSKVACSKAKEVDYNKPFIFHSADEQCITRFESKQAKVVKSLDKCL